MKRGGSNVNASLLIGSYSTMETGIICVTVRRVKERTRVSRGAAVANQSAGGSVEAATVPG